MKNVFMFNSRTRLVEVQNEKQATVGSHITHYHILRCTVVTPNFNANCMTNFWHMPYTFSMHWKCILNMKSEVFCFSQLLVKVWQVQLGLADSPIVLCVMKEMQPASHVLHYCRIVANARFRHPELDWKQSSGYQKTTLHKVLPFNVQDCWRKNLVIICTVQHEHSWCKWRV